MNMFKGVKATSVQEYLDQVPEERKDIINFLHQFIQKAAPKLKPHFAYNMLGYGSFDYVNYKKEQIKWPIVALANQKSYVSVYVCALKDGQYLAETYAKELGKVNVGKSCIRIKKLDDINLDVLEKVIKAAATNPGLIGANEHKKK